ncbi:MAG: TonB-dependent receptor [Pyrinomonadaceae bacterium]
MRVFTVFALLCFLAVGALAQNGRVKGKVVSGGGPVAGATVTASVKGISGHEVTAQTRSDGSFSIDLPLGQYYLVTASIKVDGTSYDSAVHGFAPSFDTADVTIEIPELPRIREQVTIAASELQTAEQVSKTVDAISAQEMRDRADFSLTESLKTIPGFRVQQLGGFGRTANIKSRGLRNQDTAILIDGIRFRDPSAITGDASPFISDFTLTSVSKIEVLRGSGSSLYGTNAIGGVVDFQTPEAKSGTHGQIGGAGGGLGLGRFRGNMSHRTGGGRFGIGTGVSRTVYTKGIDGNDKAYNTNFQTRIDARPYDGASISGRIFFSDAKVRLNSNPDTLGALPISNSMIINAKPGVNFAFDADDPDSEQRSRFFDGQVAVEQVLNSKVVLSGYYQGLRTRRTNDNGPLGVGFQSSSTSVFAGTIHTANAHLTWTPTRENTLTAGYEFELERFGNEGRTPSGADNFFTKAGQHSSTFYAQDLLNLLDGRLQLAGGARVQWLSLDQPEFSLVNAPYGGVTLTAPPTAVTFDGSASYFFRNMGTKVRAHVGNGYRIPSLYERFGTFFSTFAMSAEFIAIGDPFLKPEKTIAFDAGIEQNLSEGKIRLSSTYFYTHLHDIIGYGTVVPDIGTTPRPFGGYVNQKGGIARGGEFSFKAKPSRSTDLFASYTYTNSDQRTPQVFGTGIISTLGIPDHQFTMVVTQRFGRLWANFDLLATSDYLAPIFSNTSFDTYIYRFNGNRRGDLTAGYTFGLGKDETTLRLYGTIENVFDNEYYENGFRTSGVTGRVGVTLSF